MATSRIITTGSIYDLSNIKTRGDLREEIDLLKLSIKNDERKLKIHLKKMPQEALKASADAVLPSFINKMIANGTWKILASGAGMLANPFSSKYKFGKNIVGSAKKLGVLAVMKGAYNLWKNKGSDKLKIRSKEKPVITKITKMPVAKPIR